MKSILLVDDEKPFLLSLRDGLLASTDDYRLLLASDGQEALQCLKTERVDLLVTDLKLPIMDGFQLLAHVSRKFPKLPVIVMTAFGTPEIEERLAKFNALHYLEKPLDIDVLASTISESLERDSRSYIRGITLATFLQLVHMEQKTCTLKVRSNDQTGYLFILKGELLDAETQGLKGEEAALQIVAWDNAEIEMDNVCRRNKKTIESSIEFVLMEAFRLKDESAQELAEAKQAETTSAESDKSPKPEDGPDLSDQLLQTLQKSASIDEFAVFDDRNFLEHHSTLPCSITHLDPAYYLAVSQEMSGLFECGKLNYLLFQTRNRQRTMFFQRKDRRVVLTLTTQAKPRQVIDDLKSDLF